jgi:hypothetical protein
MLLAPPNVAIVAARIVQFDSLPRDDQLRAAALALKRDFSIETPTLRLTAIALDSERALIAYATGDRSNLGADEAGVSIDARWLSAVADGTIYWIANNTSENLRDAFLLSDLGAATIEHWQAGDAVPAALIALIGERSRRQQNARVIIVETSHGSSGIDADTLALWQASLGAQFERGSLPGTARTIALLPVPKIQATQARAAIDRALVATTCASALCAALALWHFADAPTGAIDSEKSLGAGAATRPGELWARTTLAAPQLSEVMSNANFGGGAWIIAAPRLPRTMIPAIESMLATNGMASQTILEPEIRIRVQRP